MMRLIFILSLSLLMGSCQDEWSTPSSERDSVSTLKWNPAKKTHYQRPSTEELKKILTKSQYHIAFEGGTEYPYINKYNSHSEAGIYVDILTGAPLFSSHDKFNSKSGWPSFTDIVHSDFIELKRDLTKGMDRIEVISKISGTHLGHLFFDGPNPTGYRYCINSDVLHFVPNTQFDQAGLKAFDKMPKGNRSTPLMKKIYLAGGCFWCVETDMDKLEGVLETVSGYMGGTLKSPTYKEVSSGSSGHLEVVMVLYNPRTLPTEKLIQYFLKHIDPTDLKGQFCDRGMQYSPAIFAVDEKQKKTAQSVLNIYQNFFQIPLRAAGEFFAAENYHQNYGYKNPLRYKYYRSNCGRDKKVKAVWEKINKAGDSN